MPAMQHHNSSNNIIICLHGKPVLKRSPTLISILLLLSLFGGWYFLAINNALNFFFCLVDKSLNSSTCPRIKRKEAEMYHSLKPNYGR